jgi:hypothetical protein
MDDDHPFLEKQMGHKPYGDVPRFWKIAIWLVCIAAEIGGAAAKRGGHWDFG